MERCPSGSLTCPLSPASTRSCTGTAWSPYSSRAATRCGPAELMLGIDRDDDLVRRPRAESNSMTIVQNARPLGLSAAGRWNPEFVPRAVSRGWTIHAHASRVCHDASAGPAVMSDFHLDVLRGAGIQLYHRLMRRETVLALLGAGVQAPKTAEKHDLGTGEFGPRRLVERGARDRRRPQAGITTIRNRPGSPASRWGPSSAVETHTVEVLR